MREDAPTNFSVLDALYTDDYVYHGIPLLGDLKGSDKSKPESPAKPTKSKTDSLGAQASLPASFH